MPPLAIETFASAVDHTLLDATAQAADIDQLCDEASRFGFAAVCLYPRWVPRARGRVEGTTAVCTVAGFPHGLDSTAAKAESARRSLAEGADEIDVVMAWQWLVAGDVAAAAADVAAVVAAARAERSDAVVKVIVESSQLDRRQLTTACAVVRDAGADFAKTSTGFVGGGATVDAVATMRGALPAEIQVKASGGIRTAAAAGEMLGAGATRLGMSSAIAVMRELTVDAVA